MIGTLLIDFRSPNSLRTLGIILSINTTGYSSNYDSVLITYYNLNKLEIQKERCWQEIDRYVWLTKNNQLKTFFPDDPYGGDNF